MAKNATLIWVAVIAAVFLIPAIRDPVLGFFSGTGGGAVTTTAGTSSLTSCPNNDDLISFSSDDVRKAQVGNSIGLAYRLFVGENRNANLASFPTGFVDKGNNADAASVNVPTIVPYLSLGGWNSGTSTLVYRKLTTGNTDCFDPLTIQPQLAVAELNTTVYVTDQDGSLNGDGAFAAAAGGSYFFTPTIQVDNDVFWGNPDLSGKNVLVVQYNDTHINKLDIPSLASTDVPSIARNNGSNWQRKAYFLQSIPENGQLSFRVNVEMESGKEPIANPDLVYFELYDADYDFDADTSALIEGVEDEDDNALGGTDSNNRFKWDVS